MYTHIHTCDHAHTHLYKSETYMNNTYAYYPDIFLKCSSKLILWPTNESEKDDLKEDI